MSRDQRECVECKAKRVVEVVEEAAVLCDGHGYEVRGYWHPADQIANHHERHCFRHFDFLVLSMVLQNL